MGEVYSHSLTCTTCNGSGVSSQKCYSCSGAGRKTCTSCDGSGKDECWSCDGTGNGTTSTKCTTCGGSGIGSCSVGICYTCTNAMGMTVRDYDGSCQRKGHDVRTTCTSCSVCGGDGKIQDGCMLDADLQSRDTIWQYNYSHDNSFGLFLNCTSYNEDSGIKDRAIVRYNLSVNDLGKKGIVYINYVSDGVYVYNNTIVTGKETENIIQSNDKRTSFFYNNLIYNRSSKASFSFTDTSGLVAEYNLVYNEEGASITNSDLFEEINTNGVYENPIFQGFLQEDSELGINNLFTFQLEYNSPALNVGKEVDAKEDFFGNPYKKSIGFYCGN